MSTFKALRGDRRQDGESTAPAVATAGRIRTLGLALVAVVGCALVVGAASASAAGVQNYACPGQGSLEHTVSLEHGSFNTACGPAALASDTEGNANAAFGFEALFHNTTGSVNTAVGADASLSQEKGAGDTAIGENALEKNRVGESNVALGSQAGRNITGSSNVDISNEGVAAEQGTTRIGTENEQTKTFVSGIFPTNLTGCFVQVTEEGQLGCNPTAAAQGPKGEKGEKGATGATGAEGPKGATGATGSPGAEGAKGATGATGATGPAGNAGVATYVSTKAVLTGKCLNFTGRAVPGTGACPAATSGYSASKLLSLPMPANGATVSNLAANTSATVSGSDTAVVEVIDNNTSATLLTCTVNSTNKNNCTNNATTGSAAALDKLEVRITATGTTGNEKLWEVTFRY
jgi:hypothetical protein